MIVCVSGKKGVGKDTLGEVLISKMKFTRVSLADPLRALCSQAFGMDYALFSLNELKDAPLAESVSLTNDHIVKMLEVIEGQWGFEVSVENKARLYNLGEMIFKTPREILQIVGTEVIRNCLQDDIWIQLAYKNANNVDGNVVITDCRFENERKFFKERGATLCLIKRGSENNGDGHSSENDLGTESDYDVIFSNDSNRCVFQRDVELWGTLRGFNK